MRMQGLRHRVWRRACSRRMAHPPLRPRMGLGRTTPLTGIASRMMGTKPPRAQPCLTAAAQPARYPYDLRFALPSVMQGLTALICFFCCWRMHVYRVKHCEG